MASVNKVTLIGNVGQDPEIKFMPSGGAVCNISISTTETWKDKQSGEKKAATEWHRVVMFNRLAEIAGEYLRKGSSVYIEGSLKTRSWEDAGVKKYSTEITGREMKMLGSRNGESSAPQAQQGGAPQQQSQASKTAGAGGFSNFDDDIPFNQIDVKVY